MIIPESRRRRRGLIVELSPRRVLLAVGQVALAAVAFALYFRAALTFDMPGWMPVQVVFPTLVVVGAVVGAALAFYLHWLWVSVGAIVGLLLGATALQLHDSGAPAGLLHAATSAVLQWHRLLLEIAAAVMAVSWIVFRLRRLRDRPLVARQPRR
jgi:hypothetical protein